MAKYRTDIHAPLSAPVRKPGVDRYAVPRRIAERTQGKLPTGLAIEASWVNGRRLAVVLQAEADLTIAQVQAAQAALQGVVGSDTPVPPFVRSEVETAP